MFEQLAKSQAMMVRRARVHVEHVQPFSRDAKRAVCR
jgi:hypothetical protein